MYYPCHPYRFLGRETNATIRALLLKGGTMKAAAEFYGVSNATFSLEMTRRGITMDDVFLPDPEPYHLGRLEGIVK